MLPIVDKPLIQYAAEEALAAGDEKLVFITGYAKRAIEDVRRGVVAHDRLRTIAISSFTIVAVAPQIVFPSLIG